MTQLTKVINFRVPFDVYEAFYNESKKDNVTLTDCILKKLRKSEKVDEYIKRIQDLEKSNKSLIKALTSLTLELSESISYKFSQGGVVFTKKDVLEEFIKQLQELIEDEEKKLKKIKKTKG